MDWGSIMNDQSKQKKEPIFDLEITFSGAGVLHIKSKELVKTPEAQRQIKALGELKEKNFLIVA